MAALLSVIIPVYNEADNISPLINEILSAAPSDTEIIFVNDGSTDHTYHAIEDVARAESRIRCVSLSRNFGHQNALVAGMNHATGKYIILMDGDLQHPPSLIPEIIAELENGFDLVNTKRINRNLSFSKKFTSSLFYKFINFISDTKIPADAADFRGFNRKVLASVLGFKERELFLRGIFSWIGYRQTVLEFEAPLRQHGKTKYSLSKMMRLALRGTTSFGFKPLRIALTIGTMISLVAFAFAIFAVISYFNGNTVPGWASLIIAIMLFGGTQLLAIGLIGEYVASLFVEVKKRPVYLIDKTINITSPEHR